VRDLGTEGRVIFTINLEKTVHGSADCIHIDEERDHWQAVLDTIKTFGVRAGQEIS
jgi:hypothetical protein